MKSPNKKIYMYFRIDGMTIKINFDEFFIIEIETILISSFYAMFFI